MKRKVEWLLSNAIGGSLLCAGLWFKVGWAWNVWRFLEGLSFVVAFATLVCCAAGNPPTDTEKLKLPFGDRPHLILSLLMACALAVYGHFLWATVVVVGAILAASVHSYAEERMEGDGRNE